MEVESWTERPAGSQRASPRPLRGAVLLAIVGAMVATRDLSFAIPRDRRQALILLGSSIPAPAWAGDVFAKRREKAEKKEMEQKVDEQGRVLVEVARPTGTKKKLYFFDLPMVPGKNWGDYSRDDEKETGTILKGAFGTAKENNIFQTQVIAGKLDDEFLERVRSQNYTAGAGMIRDVETPQQVDLEWIDYEKRRYDLYKIHNFARVLRAKTENQTDLVVFFRIQEPQLGNYSDLWPKIRDTFRPGTLILPKRNTTQPDGDSLPWPFR